MDDVRSLQQDQPAGANEYSVRLELQADCLAGVWANSIFQRDNVLGPGDIREGLSAAESVGDDRIQMTTTGRINPESFTHGTSEQRVSWFNAGYETGDPAACDTFNNNI
jgi:predicted metalloprotease